MCNRAEKLKKLAYLYRRIMYHSETQYVSEYRKLKAELLKE